MGVDWPMAVMWIGIAWAVAWGIAAEARAFREVCCCGEEVEREP